MDLNLSSRLALIIAINVSCVIIYMMCVAGVGHSMGASALLIAALKDPTRFSALVLYEPIIFPPHLVQKYTIDMKDSPLAVLARKRRNSFSSFKAAHDNFKSKLPFSTFDSEVVLDYVKYGLVGIKDKDIDAAALAEEVNAKKTFIDETTVGELCMRCRPEFEAFVYNSVSAYYMYEKILSLADIPVIIVSGMLAYSFAQHIFVYEFFSQ